MRFALKFLVLLVFPIYLMIGWDRGTLPIVGPDKVEAGETPEFAPMVMDVEVGTVEVSTPSRTLSVMGTVESHEVANIAPQIMAKVKEVKVEEGDDVSHHQVLCVLDDSEVNAKLAEAKAAVRSVSKAMEVAQAGKMAAEANLKAATAHHERFNRLFSEGSFTQKELDDVNAAYEAAKAGVLQADAQIAALEAQRKQAQAGLRTAEIYQDYAVIKAPFDGRIVRKMVDVGNLAAPGHPLFVIEQRDYRFSVPVEETVSVQKGQPVNVEVDAIGWADQLSVSEMVPSVDPMSRTYTVRVNVPDVPGLKAGMFGRATFAVGQGAESIYIPAGAVKRWYQFTGVYVVGDDSKAHLRFVRLGRSVDSRVEVIAGLKPGERIALNKLDEVADGSPIMEGF
ncbi:MAG: efflux RND transporter periplasmic adaptor subunit [Nitrospirota bacterium]|jgi:multidrug efflux pump subunit AcrA (membrane-fusion protein)